MTVPLLLLLALSSASFQDIVEKHSVDRNVNPLNPDLEDKAPEMTDITFNTSILIHRHLFPTKMKQKRQTNGASSTFDNSKLKWQTWSGSLPNGAVSIYNTYEGRTDYVCKKGCHAGFYSRSLGDFCHYPYGYKEYRVSSFDILVNEDNFEILEWKEDSDGSVPQHAVRSCFVDELYVAKNKYGLGKVHTKYNGFFLPWKGDEYWYKYYEVLTFDRDIDREVISDVRYKTNDTNIIRYPPETISMSSITNNECNPVSKSVTLSKTVREEKRWDVGASVSFGVSKTLTAGIPSIASGEVEISTQLTFDFSGGGTVTEESSFSSAVEICVPPNHHCKVKMVAYKYKVNIPFNAFLTRTYRNGAIKESHFSGTYNSIQTGEVRIVVERCNRLTSAQPCP